MTILGQHITLIRPSIPRNPIIFKSDLPVAQYDTQPKTNEVGVAAFFRLCMQDWNGYFDEPKSWRR